MSLPPVTPLQWPASFKRTHGRDKCNGRFKMSFPLALRSLHAAMKRRGLARHEYVISSNLPLKLNGDPTPVGGYVSDVGIAVYWKERNKPVRVVACDQFWHAEHNIRALALALEHLRDMERWGCTQLVEHIMQHGFALPGPGQTSTGTETYEHVEDAINDQRRKEPTRAWISILGFSPVQTSWRYEDVVRTSYRRLIAASHPDYGGSTERSAALNVAWEQAQAWFRWNEEHGDGV